MNWMSLCPFPPVGRKPMRFRANTHNHGLDIARIEMPVAKLFSDHRIKQLLITESGLRAVYQLSQPEKSRYLVFRMAEFVEMTVNPDFLRELMDEMHNLRDNIDPRS